MSYSEYPRRILVTGGKGQLGRELQRLLDRRSIPFEAPDLDELDVTDVHAVKDFLLRMNPGIVIHTAAWTDVDACERDADQAYRVNTEATAQLARLCADRGIFLAYLSTDFVFGGAKDSPYEPDDSPNPLSAYGRTKWEGEEAIRRAGGAFAIMRTSWVFGVHGRNFPKSILRAAAARRAGEADGPLRVVDDQVGSPTYAGDLAWTILELLSLHKREPISPPPPGIYHVANRGQCSWYHFAQEILKQAGWDVPVEPITSTELGRPARRPAYSVLSLKRLDDLGIQMRPWRAALRQFLEDLRPMEPRLFP